ncbi:ankyrin, partial [Setomelanomma holmii]
DINSIFDTNRTAISQAAELSHFSTAQLLLEKGAHLSLADNRGNTPLYWAVGRGQTELVQLLLCHGADIKALDDNGMTP